MKRIIFLIILVLSAFCVNAQQRNAEYNLYDSQIEISPLYKRGQVYIGDNTFYKRGHIYIDGNKITRRNMSLYLDDEMQKIYHRSRRCFEAGNALAYTGCGFIALGGVCFFGEVISSDYGNPDAPTSGLGIVAGLTFASFGAILGGTGLLVRAAGKDRMITLGTTLNGIGLTVKF